MKEVAMSTVEQAMAESTVPVSHALLKTRDLTRDQTMKLAHDTNFHLMNPGYRLVRNNLHVLGAIADGVTPEYQFQLSNAHVFSGGFPHDDHEYDVEEDGLTEIVPSAVKIMRRMKRDQFIRVIAPLFIYARSHIRSGYHSDPEDEQFINLIEIKPETQTVKAYTSDDIKVAMDKFLHQEAYESCGFSRTNYGVHTTCSSLFGFDPEDISLTSTGIFFREGGEIEWDTFDVPYSTRPSNPWASNAPSPRSVIVRLLRELDAQSDMSLISIGVNLLTGRIVEALEDHERTVQPRILINGEDNIWPLMFPKETTQEPVFL